MKKNLINILIIFFYTSMIYGQGSPLNIDFTPKSPDISSLFNFNDIEIGYYSGVANTNIPLVSFKEGPLSADVSLSYNTSGLKVTERSSLVGLGWNLNAGGMVTREIRGKADDDDDITCFLEVIQNYNSANSIKNLDVTAKKNLYDELSKFGCYDTEPDVYKFNVANISGTFMFDWNGDLIVACDKNVKVEYTQAPNKKKILEWKIIDDLGNIYIFSELETNEKTGLQGYSIFCNQSEYTTAWKITTIKDYSDNYRLDFTYEPYIMNYPVEYSVQNTISIYGGHVSDDYSRSGLTIKGSYLRAIKGKQSGNLISFRKHSEKRNDVEGENLFPLGGVELKNKNNYTISNFKLNYITPKRLLLKDIDRISGGNSLSSYQFVYNMEESDIPDYNSYAIDHWGFYNGETTNITPYPEFIYGYDHPRILEGANKEPNENYSKALTLSKIIYPTKGYSEFSYEANDYSYIQSKSIDKINLEAESFDVKTAVSTFSKVNSTQQDFSNTQRFKVTINSKSNNSYTSCSNTTGKCLRKINYQVRAINMAAFAGPVFGPKVIFYNQDNEIVYQTDYIHYDKNNFDNGGTYSQTGVIWLPEGEYTMIASTKYVPNPNQIKNFIVMQIDWKNDKSLEKNLVKVKKGGGVRIKSISEHQNNGEFIKKREFIYNGENGYSSGSIDALPKYEDLIETLTVTPVSDLGHNINMIFEKKNEIVRYSGSLLQLGSNYGLVRYNKVTVNNLDKNSNNDIRTVFKFTKGEDDIITFDKPYAPATSKYYTKGLLKEKIDYKKENGIFLPIQKTVNHYDEKDYELTSLKVGRALNTNFGVELTDFADSYYKTFIGFSKLIKTDVETFFDSKSIKQETINNYDSGLNRVVKTQVKNSKNETIETEYFYTDMKNDLVSNKMQEKNIIAKPIEVTVSKNNNFISSQKTIYKDFNNGLYLPEIIQTSKGSQVIDDRVVYHNYDNKGNPTEVSKKDGTSVVYIWGYHQTQPIAKLEGVTLSTLSKNTIDNLQTLSNRDNDRTLGYQGKEGDLREALAALRSLPELSKALITTYTYDPLIGITSITDPRGYVMYYEYDNLNRLEFIKDAAGNIVQETQYNYKN